MSSQTVENWAYDHGISLSPVPGLSPDWEKMTRDDLISEVMALRGEVADLSYELAQKAAALDEIAAIAEEAGEA